MHTRLLLAIQMISPASLTAIQVQALINGSEQALDAAIQRAQHAGAWDAHWARPQLTFTQRGKAAGTAHAGRWQIRLNPRLLASAPTFSSKR